MKDQVDSEEFSNKSEAVNALIRKAQETEKITEHLKQAEESGYSEPKPDQLLAESKQAAKSNGR